MTLLKPEKKGSSAKDEPVFLSIGKIRRPHGVQGEMLMDVYTDFPERLVPGKTVYTGEKHTPQIISGIRTAGKNLLICFAEFNSPETAGIFRNQIVYVRKDETPPLSDGEYYHHDLYGCRVQDEQNCLLGTVSEIIETGANDVLVIKNLSGEEILFPIIDEVILNVDILQKIITVKPQKWE